MNRKEAISNIISSCILIFIGWVAFKSYWKGGKKNEKPLESYRNVIAEISEIIIPATDTPGAKDAKVEDYIIKIITTCTHERERYVFLSGLRKLEAYSFENFSTAFLECTQKNKLSILQHFESKGSFTNSLLNRLKVKIFGRSFFEHIKQLTVEGYCTSMLGATKGLVYEHVPIYYISCLSYLPNQKSWATK